MSQSRLGSFIEAWVNVLIGFGINFVANLLVLPHFGFAVTMLRDHTAEEIRAVIERYAGSQHVEWSE